RAMHVDVEVIAMSGHGNIATAVQMIKLGAFDYLEKPLSSYGVLAVVEHAVAHHERRHNPGSQGLAPSHTAVASTHSTASNLTHRQEAMSASRVSIHRCWQASSAQQSSRYYRQRTLDRSVVLYGQGLQSGLKTGLILSPMPPDSGILFRNITTGKTVPA